MPGTVRRVSKATQTFSESESDTQYSVFVIMSCRDLSAELPFVLMHPKPEEEPEVIPKSASPNLVEGQEVPVENLIQLDT
jgi:hypothetical protein